MLVGVRRSKNSTFLERLNEAHKFSWWEKLNRRCCMKMSNQAQMTTVIVAMITSYKRRTFKLANALIRCDCKRILYPEEEELYLSHLVRKGHDEIIPLLSTQLSRNVC